MHLDEQEQSELTKLNQSLLRCQSITPEDGGTFRIISDFCTKLNMQMQRYDHKDTKNFFAYTSDQPSILFCGHVDVVPPGDLEKWSFPPFSALIKDGTLYGRGCVDMKSSIAAFLAALKRMYTQKKLPKVAILLTSDEEGPAKYGVRYAIEQLHQDGFRFPSALVGEPTSTHTLGDTLKIGRRGSLTAMVQLNGQQGHVAYPKAAKNPIPAACKIIANCSEQKWDEESSLFPETSCICTSLHSQSPAGNMSPSDCSWQMNFRFPPHTSVQFLQEQTQKRIEQFWNNPYTISWRVNAEPFASKKGPFSAKCTQAIQDILHISPALSTSGGTSDARFLHHYIEEIIEFGPLNKTAHKTNECITISELNGLSVIYERILQLL
ncbi:MAG: succinyl-diaminopimelate desuccinylase [Pseudomonadota bacterium]|nr:succinyl-diaminopimelate desuccinylase [Pseudomonadota bacterium]